FFPRLRPPPPSTPFPYTTLFRSVLHPGVGVVLGADPEPVLGEIVEGEGEEIGVGPAFLLPPPVEVASGDDVVRHAAVVEAEKARSEEHTSELQSRFDLVCRLLLE